MIKVLFVCYFYVFLNLSIYKFVNLIHIYPLPSNPFYKAVIRKFEYLEMLFSKALIIDNQRIRFYQMVGKFTRFRWAVSLAILVKVKNIKGIDITTSIFYYFPFANNKIISRN